jgi:cold shock protein
MVSLSSPICLEGDAVSALVARIVQARRLYGPDSSYVVGLISGMEWLLDGVDGGAKTKDQIHSRILETESGKAPRSVPEAAPPAAAAGETLAENTWIKGIVKWFNNDKGYGFISTESHIDVFVHWRDISSWDRSLCQGDEVEFMVTRTAKGFQAINVMKGGQDAESSEESPKEGTSAETGPEPSGESDGGTVEPPSPAEEAAAKESAAEDAEPDS